MIADPSALAAASAPPASAHDLALALARQRRWAEAASVLAGVAARAPEDAALQFAFALALQEGGRTDLAVAQYERVLAIDPGRAEAHHNLAVLLYRRRQFDAALHHCDAALALVPGRAQAHYNRGATLVELGRHEEALASYRQALALDPASAAAHNAIGNALATLGRMAEACAALAQAVMLAPRNGAFRLDLAGRKRFAAGDPDIAAMAALAADPALPEEDRLRLNFALGKAYRDLVKPAAACRHLAVANGLQRRRGGYDEALQLSSFTRMAEAFSADLIARRSGGGHPSALPVLIIGMPRSGTSLVEQILASHPAIAGAGEIPDLGREAAALGRGRDIAGLAGELGEREWRGLGERYAARLAQRAPGALRVTDKLPSNFFFAGLLHLALPNARLVHVRRDPVDTCFSCWAHYFPAAPQTADLAALGRYFRGYAGLMAHWRRVLPPGVMLDVDYERLVADTEAEARRMVAHCGLPWDERCLAHVANRRAVTTLSAAQVREPVYRTAIGGARPYLPWLAPLLDALGPLAAA